MQSLSLNSEYHLRIVSPLGGSAANVVRKCRSLHTNNRPVNVEIQDTKGSLLSSMAAIFSHIAPGGEQCYYAAAQYTNINFQSFSFHRYQSFASEFH
jgi:hypothetical protein